MTLAEAKFRDKQKAPGHTTRSFFSPGNDLLSYPVSRAAPSAHRGLTSVFGKGLRLIQEKIRGNEAALDRIHGETGLLKHGEAQQDGIPGLPKDHTTGNGFPIHRDCGVTDVPFRTPAIGEHEGHRTDFLDPEPTEELARNHTQRGTGIRKRGNLF
jgi:hypothetical protein